MTRPAKLVFDSDNAGSRRRRGAALWAKRSLCFQAERIGVDIVIHVEGEALEVIHGQVFRMDSGDPFPDAIVRVVDQRISVLTDRHGEFALSAVSGDGPRVLSIECADTRILCPLPIDRTWL